MRLPKFLNILYSQIKSLNPPYPGLKYKIENDKEIWEGTLAINARYDSIRVKDEFEVRIELPSKVGFPKVQEIGGRIEKIISQRKIKDSRDLHADTNKIICLCPEPELRRRFPGEINLTKFIEDLVIPYFFELHKFEKTGKWILGQYNHGELGIMEYYLEHRNVSDQKLLDDCLKSLKFINNSTQYNGHEHCFCGSKIKFKKCHPNALRGLQAIIEDRNKFYNQL